VAGLPLAAELDVGERPAGEGRPESAIGTNSSKPLLPSVAVTRVPNYSAKLLRQVCLTPRVAKMRQGFFLRRRGFGGRNAGSDPIAKEPRVLAQLPNFEGD
jgi:hypothetical protein